MEVKRSPVFTKLDAERLLKAACDHVRNHSDPHAELIISPDTPYQVIIPRYGPPATPNGPIMYRHFSTVQNRGGTS
jgi:hypothetical protein